MVMKVETSKLSASGVVTSHSAILMGVNVDADVTEVTAITVYNGTSATDTKPVLCLQSWGDATETDTGRQTTSNWSTSYGKACPNGIYVNMSTSVDVYVDWIRDGA